MSNRNHSDESCMSTIGLDVGDRITHFCALDSKRNVVRRQKFSTNLEQLQKVFDGVPRCVVILEAGSQSPWMSPALEELGHDAFVADPRRVALVTKDHRKSDRRDAETLARLVSGVPELLGRVRHRSADTQADLAVMRMRDMLVRQRSQLVQHIRGTLKAFGIRLRSGDARSFHKWAPEQFPELLHPALSPAIASLEDLAVRLADLNETLDRVAKERHPETVPLREVNGVGPLTALAFVLTIEDPERFAESRQVGSWVGLCPKSHASGDQNPQLGISRAGNGYLRRLLIQCAHYILGPFGKPSDLRIFGLQLVARGGRAPKKRAAVAVARKLSVMLHRMWVTQEPYEPLRLAKGVEVT